MDKYEDKLTGTYGRKGGWKVPEGYFEKAYKEISEKLPDAPEVVRHVPMTRWQRLKPYIYLAAMFAGIWLMMQVFHHAAGDMTLNLDNPPEHIAMAMQDSDINSDYFIIPESYSEEAEMVYEVSSQYNSIEDFAEDFGYKMEPEYASMKINE